MQASSDGDLWTMALFLITIFLPENFEKTLIEMHVFFSVEKK